MKMEEQKYRGQLIRVVATEAPGTQYWVARADVRYQDRKGLRFFPLEGPRDKFTTKEAAERNIIEEAKKLIDSHTKS
jgi:hypothetical protein